MTTTISRGPYSQPPRGAGALGQRGSGGFSERLSIAPKPQTLTSLRPADAPCPTPRPTHRNVGRGVLIIKSDFCGFFGLSKSSTIGAEQVVLDRSYKLPLLTFRYLPLKWAWETYGLFPKYSAIARNNIRTNRNLVRETGSK